MLSRDQCERYEAILLHEISKRRSLGGYSPDAGSLLTLCEICYEIVGGLVVLAVFILGIRWMVKNIKVKE